jgi:hypothetical protein
VHHPTEDFEGGIMQKYMVFLTLALMSSTAFATINAFPSSVNFFNVKIGLFQSQRVTVQNLNGPAEQVSVSNSCFGDFMVNSMCNLTLGPNDSCSIDIQFQPRREGFQICSIFISGLHGGGANVSVSGQGVRSL